MNRNIIVIFIGLFGAYLGQSILSPVFSPLVREMGLKEFHSGLILSSAALTWTLTSPFWGRQSEKWGRKRVFVIGLFGYGIASLLFGFFSDSGLKGVLSPIPLLLLLMLSRAMVGLLLSASPTSALAYVADVSEGEERTKNISLISAGMGLGTVVGPAFGAIVVGFGLVAPIFFAATIAIVCAVLSLIFIRNTDTKLITQEKPKVVSPLDSRIRSYLVIGLFMFLTLSIVQIVIGFYFQDRLLLTAQEAAEKTSLAFVLKGTAVIITQMWLVRLLKASPIKLIRIGMPIILLSLISFLLSSSFAMLTLSMVLMGFGLGFVQPGFYSATSLAVNEEEQGAVAGLSSATLALSSVLGQLLGGAFYQVASTLPFIISLVIISFSTVLIFYKKK